MYTPVFQSKTFQNMQFFVTKFLILKKLDIISFACPVLKHTCTSTYTVEATYKGAFIRVRLLIRVHFENYGFFPISRLHNYVYVSTHSRTRNMTWHCCVQRKQDFRCESCLSVFARSAGPQSLSVATSLTMEEFSVIKFHYVFVMMDVGSLLTDTLVLSHAGYVMVYLILCYVFRLSVSASLLWYSMNVIGFDRRCPYYIYVEKLGTPDHPLSISTEVLSVFLKIYSTEKQNVKLTHHLILPLDITMGRWGYLRFDGRL